MTCLITFLFVYLIFWGFFQIYSKVPEMLIQLINDEEVNTIGEKYTGQYFHVYC